MFGRIITIVILVPVAVILVALAVANRQMVPFTIDPFHPGNPSLTLALPLFIYLFLALAIGMIVGSMATWFGQAHYRRDARRQSREVERLRADRPAAASSPANASSTSTALTRRA